MSSPTDLKTIGLKATLPRLRILELFEKSPVRHLSAEEVYRLLSREGTETGLAFTQAQRVPALFVGRTAKPGEWRLVESPAFAEWRE